MLTSIFNTDFCVEDTILQRENNNKDRIVLIVRPCMIQTRGLNFKQPLFKREMKHYLTLPLLIRIFDKIKSTTNRNMFIHKS
jgi:CRISPR/Cas system endoribonuclease Cas6 (RAMP superfamily)